MLEELDVWEGEEEEAKAGLRWERRELSKDCSDRYGAENSHNDTELIITFNCTDSGLSKGESNIYLDRSDTLAQRV